MSGSNLIEEYFNYQSSYEKKYSEKTIVLMQVGSFHEAYQTLNQGYDLSKLSNILNIIVSKKNKSNLTVDIKNPYMMGFPSASLQKYLKILVENYYTVVIIDQVTPPPYPKREITGIYTPGTYCEEITNPDSNYLVSIYIEEVSPKPLHSSLNSNEFRTNMSNKNSMSGMFLSGISIIDVTTGKSFLYEFYSQKTDENITLDDITKIIQSYSIKELVLTTHNLTSMSIDKLVAYLELSDKLYHHQTISQLTSSKGYKNVPNIDYQQEIFKKVYGNKLSGEEQLNIIESMNLERLSYARISLVILLNYLNEHNQILLKNLDLPVLMEKQNYMFLGNNATYQLNIFNNDVNNTSGIFSNGTKYKSLFDVINKTSTSMGRRYLKNSLINPLLDEKVIINRYNIIEYLMENNRWKQLEIKLNNVPDIERYVRKISMSTINPIDLNNCLMGIDNAYDCLVNIDLGNNEILGCVNRKKIINDVNNFINEIEKKFNRDELSKYLINDITGPIFCSGVYKDIDKLIYQIKLCDDFMEQLSSKLNDILNTSIPKKKSKTVLDDDETVEQLIKIDYNERDGYHLSLTKRRAELLQSYLEKNNVIDVNGIKLNKDQMEFRSLLKGNSCKILIPAIQKKSDQKIELVDELKKEIKEKYVLCLSEVYNKYADILNNFIDFISQIDFLKSGAKIACENKYYRPTINNKYNNRSYIDAENMRHPICEKILIDTEYVPISIKLGVPDQSGILLFGLNSVGKSTLQKSIGINIILAQIGFYVPANKFEYYPYTSLMTRISANDNLFKGLSSFALELSELRAILKRSNLNTLIIADEVCKGTEHQSSLIIVMAMLEILSQNKCSFITATHLHDLTTMSRLHNLTDVKLFHLHVDYDEKTNVLKYNRRLLEGPGENFYGLNVAKYLINDSLFLKVTNEIKTEMFPQYMVGDKKSKYNSNLWINECQICEYKPKNDYDKPLETHHINFQKDCDKNGFLLAKPHIHKNHKSNLCVLCYKCHDKIDTNEIIIYGYEDTVNGSQLKYKINDNKIISVENDNITIELEEIKTEEIYEIETIDDKVKNLLSKKYTNKKILETLKDECSQYMIKKIIAKYSQKKSLIKIEI
jgi:DNA mismatch repair protein MutS